MCGIAGFYGSFKQDVLAGMGRALAHRGPDGEGTWADPEAGIALAHRRLSIIDLSAAASQPMAGVGGRYQIVFNGEIYNYKALRETLEGYSFNRDSDTAVLCPLYDKYGPAMLDKLEGMFAMAIWDREAKLLWIARDHAGIKPLYYAETPQGLVFASEMKALLGVPGVDLSPDPAAIADYMTLLWSPGERTQVRGIKKLLPGHWLRARRAGKKLEIEHVRWWWPPQAPLVRGKPLYDDSLKPADLLALLDEVVAEQCVSDVPVGAFLSGGVDSSALVASMVANGQKPAMTYCIGFSGKGMAEEGFSDDLSHAKMVAQRLGVPLTPVIIQPEDVLGRLPRLAAMLDEPTADPAPLFVQDICARARADGITVLLSGTGGDDLMSGYRRHLTARMRQRLGGARVPLARGLKCGLNLGGYVLPAAMRRRAHGLLSLMYGTDEAFLVNAFKTNSHFHAWRLLKREWREELSGGWENALTRARDETVGQDLVDRLLYQEQFGFLPDHNLNYGDKASMASGVEVRVPLTDRRLMQFMARVSPEKKLHRTRLKAFFKDAVSHRLPYEVLNRSKAGFGAPIRAWLATPEGPGRGMIEEAIFSPEAAEMFDIKAVGNFWQRTLAGEVDGAYTALALAMQVWGRAGAKG